MYVSLILFSVLILTYRDEFFILRLTRSLVLTAFQISLTAFISKITWFNQVARKLVVIIVGRLFIESLRCESCNSSWIILAIFLFS